jgi:monofunctional biosynthetic peptidoglycan transglycosylase
MNADGNTEKTILDFSTATNGPVCEVVNYGVMGGLSRSSISMTNTLLVFRGEVSLENNGGFASVRSAQSPQNLTGFGALVLRARGDGKRYKFTVRTETGFNTPLYQCTFITKRGECEEHGYRSKTSFQHSAEAC